MSFKKMQLLLVCFIQNIKQQHSCQTKPIFSLWLWQLQINHMTWTDKNDLQLVHTPLHILSDVLFTTFLSLTLRLYPINLT